MKGERDIARDAVRAALTQGASLPAAVSDRREIMGGHGTITVVGAGVEVLDDAWAVAARLESLWSRFLADSDLQRLNWAEGMPVEVSPETLRLIGEMITAYTLTDGDFDPTLLPHLLDHGYVASLQNPRRLTTLPTSAVAGGDPRHIVISDRRVTLPRGMTLDAGGMGKGLAGDVIAERVMAHGALGVMVELLGDIVVDGLAPDGVAWRLAVEDPFDVSAQLALVRLSKGAIVTSSQRKRRFNDGAEHHLLDPRNGASAQTEVQTATIIAGTGAHAEALSKSAFVRSPDEFLAWVIDMGAAAMVVLANGDTMTSENWSRYL